MTAAMKSSLSKIFILWMREVKRYWREKSRILSSVVTPLLWLIIFGTGIGMGRFPGIGDYQTYIFPGIIGMTLLFTSIWSGISVIWDREFGFLKEILVAPVSKSAIVLGKAFGGGTAALIQGCILLLLSPLFKIRLNFYAFLSGVILMIIISTGLVSIGLLIASLIDSLEGFNLIMSFVILPMFFLSGALFPLNVVPEWLRGGSYFNPLTYGVDALRTVILGSSYSLFPIYIDIAVLLFFSSSMILLCSYTFDLKR